MFNKSKKTYGFRKAKAVTTIGGTEVGNKMLKGAIATAVAVVPLAVGGVASADEVGTATNTNPNPATNLVDAQPTPTEENTAMVNNADTPSQDMTGTVDTSARDTAVTTAENAGVDVTTDNTTKTYDNIADAQADIANQTATVKEATDKANANSQAIADAEAQNAQIDAENKAEAERVAKANEEGQKAVDEANAKAQAEADATNAKLKADYEQKLADIKDVEAQNAEIRKKNQEEQARVDALNAKAQSDYEKAKSAYDAKVAEEMANLEANKNTDGYLSTAETQQLIFKSEPNAKHSVNKSPATAEELARVEQGMRQETIDAMNNSTSEQYIISTGESIEVTYTNLENSSLNGSKISKVVYTYTLNHSDYGNEVVLGFNVDPTKTLWYLNGDKEFNLNMDVKFYDENGRLITPTGALVSFSSLNTGGINGDWEGVSDFSGDFLAINGSSIAVQADGVARSNGSNSYKSLGSKYDAGEWDVDGNPLEYYGAIVGKSNGTINFNIRSNGRGYVWFAFNSNVKSPVLPTPPSPPKIEIYTTIPEKEVPTTPAEPEYVTVTPETFIPETPTVKPYVDVPDKENYNVSVHPVEVKQNPTISKLVSNDSGQDVDGKLVPKGAEAPYTLDVGSLTAGRPELTENGGVVIYDSLPSGYVLSEAEMEKTISEAEKLGFTTEYDEATSTFKLTLNADEIKKVNANRLTSDYDIPNPVIYGTPINDNATYINASTLVLTPTDSSGKELDKITTTSNKVVIYTAGTDDPENKEHGGSTIQPTKQVLDENGNDIDGKAVEKGQKIVYVGKWDLDQYKDIMAGAVAISKGFGFIDNYDESAVTMDIAGTTITSASGKTVTGLTPYVVKNLSDAPQELKDLIANAGIEIADNDEFVIWVADDPQAFYDEYVVTGDSIFFTMPAQVKDDFEGEQFDNIVYQIDFGNGYAGNVVTNKIETPIEPETPAEPEVVKPTSEVPVVKASVLPETGETSNGMLATIGMFILATLTAFTFGKSKKSEE